MNTPIIVSIFSFWIEVEDFKKMTSPEDLARRAKEIFVKYFTAGSVYELYLSEKAKDVSAEQLRNPTAGMFDSLQHVAWSLLIIDTVQPFLKSEYYEKYKAGVTLKPINIRTRGNTTLMLDRVQGLENFSYIQGRPKDSTEMDNSESDSNDSSDNINT